MSDADAQRAADLQTRLEATDAQLRNLRIAFDNAARERDELTVRLLRAEQLLAGVARPGATVPRAELNEAQDRVEELKAMLRRRRGTAKRLRARNRALRRREAPVDPPTSSLRRVAARIRRP